MSKRKHFTPEQKVATVRRHLLDGVPVSDLCDELGIHATQYYNWQKQLFENAASAFERRPNSANQRRQQDAQAKKIAQLEAKLWKMNEVVAELLEEHVQLKKSLGNPSMKARCMSSVLEERACEQRGGPILLSERQAAAQAE